MAQQRNATGRGAVEVHVGGRLHRLDEGEIVIGRDPVVDVALADDRVSRRHAAVRLGAGGWEVVDLGSTNGTWIGSQQVLQAPVVAPTTFYLGAPGNGVAVHVVPVGATSATASEPAIHGGYLETTGEQPAARGLGFVPGDPVPPRPPTSPRRRERKASNRPPASGTYRGIARGIQTRSESFGQGQSRQILNFRLERYDDEGNRAAPLPVELRAYWLSGHVAEGEEVEVSGHVKRGILRVKRIRNLTTGAAVEQPRGKTWLMWILGVIVVAFLVAIALGFVYVSQNQPDFGPPGGFGG